jgi:hypothetical protein
MKRTSWLGRYTLCEVLLVFKMFDFRKLLFDFYCYVGCCVSTFVQNKKRKIYEYYNSKA